VALKHSHTFGTKISITPNQRLSAALPLSVSSGIMASWHSLSLKTKKKLETLGKPPKPKSPATLSTAALSASHTSRGPSSASIASATALAAFTPRNTVLSQTELNVKGTTGSPRPPTSVIAPATSPARASDPRPSSSAQSALQSNTIKGIAIFRTLLNLSEKVLDGLPIWGPKAGVAAVSEVLKAVQVRLKQSHAAS
jgi:hypothetical protein